MRLFFALWPDPEVTRQLTRVARHLDLDGCSRRVDPKNYHLTLAFVGEVSADKLAGLQQIGGSVRVPQFSFDCDSLEFWQEPQVVVAAVRAAPPPLLELWMKLNDGKRLPRERFRAHVTLARKVAQVPVLPAMSPIEWRTATFSLIRSHTGGVESAYTVVDTWSLLDKAKNP